MNDDRRMPLPYDPMSVIAKLERAFVAGLLIDSIKKENRLPDVQETAELINLVGEVPACFTMVKTDYRILLAEQKGNRHVAVRSSHRRLRDLKQLRQA